MALSKEKQFSVDTNTLSSLRGLIPSDAPMTFTKSNLAEQLNTTVPRLTGSLARLSSRSLIDYETTGRGTITICVSHNGAPVRESAPAPKRALVCRACGAIGHNDEAMFCWKCGKPLRTHEEVLKNKFSAIMARFPRLYGANVQQADDDMGVLREIYDRAFPVEKGGE